ncbi:MAG: hypothetical protein Q9182_005225 [Xanthomendoza sp. 2 TL-2023]
MNDVREMIEDGLEDKEVLRAIFQKAHAKPWLKSSREEKFALRRMMSRYWSNSSMFAVDLVGAVIRQGTFIEKMHAIDWLHSPAAPSTMQRLLTKYNRYFTILKEHEGMVAVPTLDVDLACYYRYSVCMTDRFIDHDDKIPAPTLSTAFEWTSKTYETMFHEIYSECTCWYCEAVRESHTSAASRHVFHRSAYKGIDAHLSNIDESSVENERPMPHISAHNAVDCPTDPSVALAAHYKKQRLDAMFEKALKRAEKKGRRGLSSNSPKDSSIVPGAHGKDVGTRYYVANVPYMADPVTRPVRLSGLARWGIAVKELAGEVLRQEDAWEEEWEVVVQCVAVGLVVEEQGGVGEVEEGAGEVEVVAVRRSIEG